MRQVIILGAQKSGSSKLEMMSKTVRILGVSLALLTLLVLATGVVSDWNHDGLGDDARCPYCHLGHQIPANLMAPPLICSLRIIAPLDLPEILFPDAGSAFLRIAPRAPPA